MKRISDLCLGIIVFFLFFIPGLFIFVFVCLSSKGPGIYWSKRVGKNNKIFCMPKFRTMILETPVTASHLLVNANDFLSPIGSLLRSTSLDELPQIFSVLKGDMSFVGPRPALFNQEDLITLRAEKGVDVLLPGITGWAQVNGRDKLSTSDKVALDEEYLNRQSFWFDIKILWKTFLKVILKDGVSH